jgi:predicted RNase H-like HicB family nuclease
MNEISIPVRIEPLEDGWFLAICDAVQGCHAEGETIPDALEYIEDVARVIRQLCQEHNLPHDPIFEGVPEDAVIRARLVETPDRA